ncbi:hypothetical protein HDU98_011667 [Podochytrium sp. JEL0797]|nr:hypothetical protein HDU98_011667 [Podochytrium sp. JEL0797]
MTHPETINSTPGGPSTPKDPMGLAPHRLVEQAEDGCIRFGGRSRNGAGFDVGVARSNTPFAATERFAYFEVTIKKCSNVSYTSLGLVSQPLQFVSHPGTDDASYGVRGQDGRKYHNATGKPYIAKFKQGDTIGCGFDRDKANIFFTCNGKHLGVAFENVSLHCWYPAVGLHDPAELVHVNLNPSPAMPFKFNLVEFAATERSTSLHSIDSAPLPTTTIHSLIQQHLLHSGYTQTLRAFNPPDLNSKKPSTTPPIPHEALLESTIDFRSAVCALIVAGNVGEARVEIGRMFPNVLELEVGGEVVPVRLGSGGGGSALRMVPLLFGCQEFVELCRARTPVELRKVFREDVVGGEFDVAAMAAESSSKGVAKKRKAGEDGSGVLDLRPKKQKRDSVTMTTNGEVEGGGGGGIVTGECRVVSDLDLTTALRTLLGPLQEWVSREAKHGCVEAGRALELLEMVAGLVAYENPFVAPQRHLFHEQHRRNLAEAVNSAILEKSGHTSCHTSTLSTLMHQLLQTRTETRTGYTPSLASIPTTSVHRRHASAKPTAAAARTTMTPNTTTATNASGTLYDTLDFEYWPPSAAISMTRRSAMFGDLEEDADDLTDEFGEDGGGGGGTGGGGHGRGVGGVIAGLMLKEEREMRRRSRRREREEMRVLGGVVPFRIESVLEDL